MAKEDIINKLEGDQDNMLHQNMLERKKPISGGCTCASVTLPACSGKPSLPTVRC